MTIPFPDQSACCPRASAHPPDAPRARGRAGPLATACLAVALGTALVAAQARKARPARAASSPSTAQILAPSASTVPDALPPELAIYRCGDSYSSHPCAPSQQPLDVADVRTDAQRRQSEQLTARDKRLAEWYEAARRQREVAPSAPARARAGAAPPACVATATMHCVPNRPARRTVSVSRPASATLVARPKG